MQTITKEYMNKNKNAFLLILILGMLSSLIMAQTTNSLLPGSRSDLDKTVSHADIIVVAKMVSLGITMPDATAQADYDSAQIQVMQALKGSPNQNLSVSISVHFSKGRIEEIAPEVGKEYLFFIRTDEVKHEIVLKIIPATDDNIARVKALIAAAPAGN